ncbi:MAG: hypothetical protein CMJ49_13045 [Planctomycetaceae bacterium]|nr:hypothetical protein [Planctomycetaceae bacterium]
MWLLGAATVGLIVVGAVVWSERVGQVVEPIDPGKVPQPIPAPDAEASGGRDDKADPNDDGGGNGAVPAPIIGPETSPPNAMGFPTTPMLPDWAVLLLAAPEALPMWPGAEMTLGYEMSADGLTQQAVVLSMRDADAAEVNDYYVAALLDRGYERDDEVEAGSPYLTFTRRGLSIMILAGQDTDRATLTALLSYATASPEDDAESEGGTSP